MDELGFTKIAAAGLVTALGIMVIRMLPDMFMHKDYPTMPAYGVGVIETADAGDTGPLPFPQPEWVAAMNVDAGAKVFKKCQACHNVEKGGKNDVGPNLYGVVGATPAQKDGFAYSGAMNGLETSWSFEQLDAYLTKPAKYLPGTKMSFFGLKKDADRAAVIEYLRVAADSPTPQPMPVAAEAEALEDNAAIIEEPASDPTDVTTEQEELQ